MAVIDIRNVVKVYDGVVPVPAVNGISLEIQKGEFTAIVGPSGSGKTTLLNLLGGLDVPTSGAIVVNGTDIGTLKNSSLIEYRLRNIGFVFQAYNLIPVLTAKENVEFILNLQGVSRGEREHRALSLLKEVGLEGRENSRPAQLSGGQQQRVAVARALAAKPQFILADEPTANLDSKSTTNLLKIMERLNVEEGMTFIFSTHDQRVIDIAHRVVKVEDGAVVSDSNNIV